MPYRVDKIANLLQLNNNKKEERNVVEKDACEWELNSRWMRDDFIRESENRKPVWFFVTLRPGDTVVVDRKI